MKRSPALLLPLFLILACGDDGGDAAIDAGPRIDSSLGAPPDAGMAACTPKSGTTAADVRLVEVATGLSNPVFVTAPAGDQRLFILEQAGRIRIVKDGALLDTPYLDISSKVNNSGGEQGLLGLAFHPDWTNNGRFYVYYSAGSGSGTSEIAEFQVTAVDSDIAPEDSERSILSIMQPATNHNGGMIAFGPDGYLYIGMGDGGGAGDSRPEGPYGQDPSTLIGSMLRIDIDDTSTGAYGIPSDNPFAMGGGAAEVFAYGLRNPWRWSFDRMNGDVYIADVGQNRIEEVNVVTSQNLNGANFGWNVYEGTECFNSGGSYYEEGAGCNLAGTVAPITEYGHTPDMRHDPAVPNPIGNSITGGYVYRGPCMPDLQGTYFYGDFVTNATLSLEWDGTATTRAPTELPSLQMGVSLGGIASFGEDGFGEMYMTSFNGNVYRLEHP